MSTAFVVTTYFSMQFSDWMGNLDFTLCAIMLFSIIFELSLAQNKCSYIWSIYTLLYIAVIVDSVICENIKHRYPWTTILLAISRMLRMLRFTKFIIRYGSTKQTNFKRQITEFIVILFTLIFIHSGIFMNIENYFRDDDSHIPFHDSIYFTVITVATVGYGDIAPISTAGRILVMVLIIMILIIIPMQTNKILDILGKQSTYARNSYNKVKNIPHVVISGELTLPSAVCFFQELYNPNHGSSEKYAVLLQSNGPNKKMETLLHDPRYEMYLTFLEGN